MATAPLSIFSSLHALSIMPPSVPAEREVEIRALRLEPAATHERLDVLETEEHTAPKPSLPAAQPAAAAIASATPPVGLTAADQQTLRFFCSTRFETDLDGCCEYDFNAHLGGRAEYFDDRSVLFSGTSQAINEVPLVADRTLATGSLMRADVRRDLSNRQFFLTATPGVFSQSQTTAAMRLMFWWGTKESSS